jgi:hypothetical protein
MSTKVSASKPIQPEDVTMKIVSFKNCAATVSGAFFLVIMSETNERQARCALEHMFARLVFQHLASNAPFELDLRVAMVAFSHGADGNGVPPRRDL